MAYKIMARNTRTKQTVAQEFLDGTVITDETLAWDLAAIFAEKQTANTRDIWEAVVKQYTPGQMFSLRG